MNIGIYCDTLSDETFEFANDLKSVGHDPIIFTNNYNTINQNDICIMNGVQIWGWNHPIIAMDHIAGRFLAECTTPTKKALVVKEYAWNLFPFEDNLRMFDNDEITLVTLNPHDHEIVKSLFHTNVCLAPGLDYERICATFA